MPNAEAHDSQIPVTDVVCSFERDYIEELVADVLSKRGKISEGARSSFNAAIDSTVRLDGFRKASRGAPDRLTPCVMGELELGNDRIAASFLRAWSDTQEALRKLVTEHLRAQSMDTDGLENRAREYRLSWTRHEWLSEIANVMESDTELSSNDVGLMLCYVSGRAVLQTFDEASVESELLAGWLDQLRELPVESEDWPDIDDFVDIAVAIAAKKRTQLEIERLTGFLEILSDLQKEFDAELKYLEIDMDADRRTVEVAESATLPAHVTELLEELRERLSEYSAVFPRADSRTEESQRAAERQHRENAVLDLMARWDAYAAEKLELDDEAVVEGGLEVGQSIASEAGGTAPLDEYDALQNKVDELTGEIESLKTENSRLGQVSDGLRVDKEALDNLNDRLREELEDSRRTEENWRKAYVAERVASADGEEEAAGPPRNGQGGGGTC